MAKKYNTQKIKKRHSYSVKEISKLLGVNLRTCSRWLEEGLKVIDEGSRPFLIMGSDLKSFLKEKQSRRKIKLGKGEYFCCKCQKATQAKKYSERIIETGKLIGKENRKQLKKIGVCKVCNTKINRFL